MTIKAGVIGFPIKHSLSPRIHGFWLKKYGIDGSYQAIEVDPEQLENFLTKTLIAERYAGVNVTLPHKEKTLKILGSRNSNITFIGAVNTVVVQHPEKGVDGINTTNTDALGFVNNLKQGAPNFNFTKGKAVVIGAGGAARPIVFSLLETFDIPELVLVNRTREKCEDIKARASVIKKDGKTLGDRVTIVEWEDRNSILSDANIVINTSSLGMVGQPPLELDISHLPKTALVTDIVYNPLETPLLKQAKSQGNIIVDGIGMLLHQAVPGFRAWFDPQGKILKDHEPEVTEELKRHVLEGLKK